MHTSAVAPKPKLKGYGVILKADGTPRIDNEDWRDWPEHDRNALIAMMTPEQKQKFGVA